MQQGRLAGTVLAEQEMQTGANLGCDIVDSTRTTPIIIRKIYETIHITI